MALWYMEKGPELDVVLSSRIRLARNLRQFPFPSRMDDSQAEEVVRRIRSAVAEDNTIQGRKFTFIDIDGLNAIDRQVLVEKHVISPGLADKRCKRGVFVSKDEKSSIMVNEEDHIRIQCIYPGLQLNNALQHSIRIDNMLEHKNDYAFSSEFGYLTCCPTNTGTGLRASAMLHLPALVITGYIKNILEACSKLNLAVRGLYGENTAASGNMFQISNQVTLGYSEDEIVAGIINIVSQIIEQERVLRNELKRQDPGRFEDRIFRSYGLLSNARIMSTREAMQLLSDVRLGVDMGMISNLDIKTINELIISIQPGSMQKYHGSTDKPEERDQKRAGLIRARLAAMGNTI